MTMPRATSLSFRLTPIALAATLLAGCNPIGGGTGPVSLTLNGPDGTVDAATGTVYECIRAGVTAALNFENGAAGDFTERVVWESDNDAVLRVSNSGTEPVPGSDGLFFGRGVLTPVAPGIARITARFSDFERTIVVTVRPVPVMRMEQRNVGTGLNQPLATIPPPEGSTEPLPPEPQPGTPAPRTRQRMGPLTTIDLTVIADLDGVPTRIDPAAQWAFDAAPAGAATPNGDIALIDPDGVVTTAAADARSLIARASFQPCGRSLATEIAVSPIQALTLVPEFGAQPLIVPNTERYFAFADFGDGPEQDISLTTTYTSGTTGTAAFLSAFIGIPNLLSSVAASADPVVLTATTPDPDADDDTVGPVTATIEQTVVTDTLVSIALEPQNPTAIAGSSLVCPLRLVGTYASGAQQDITRRGSYVSETQTIGVVSSTPLTSGQISVAGRDPGTSLITATVVDGTNTLTATTTYALVAPATPAPATCPQTFDPLPGQVITP